MPHPARNKGVANGRSHCDSTPSSRAGPRQAGKFLGRVWSWPWSPAEEAAKQRDFLAGVLDHLMRDEALLAFALSIDIEPQAISRAHADLGGRSWEQDLASHSCRVFVEIV